jgi:hypothetical protein
MVRTIAIAVLALFCCSGCAEEESSVDRLKKQMKEAASNPPPPKDNIKVITSPVPYGRTVPCTTMVDAARASGALGRELTVKELTKDASYGDAEAAAVCALHTTGKPLSEKEQKKIFDTQGMKLGVQPGDELCQVTAYCWAGPPEVAAMKKDCEDKGQTTSTEIGDLTCVQTLEAGADYRYVYSVLDPDTKCKLVTRGGPSVTDEAIVKGCAKVFSEIIGPDQIKVQ